MQKEEDTNIKQLLYSWGYEWRQINRWNRRWVTLQLYFILELYLYVPFTYSFHISNKRIWKEIEIRNYKETMLQQLYISKK